MMGAVLLRRPATTPVEFFFVLGTRAFLLKNSRGRLRLVELSHSPSGFFRKVNHGSEMTPPAELLVLASVECSMGRNPHVASSR